MNLNLERQLPVRVTLSLLAVGCFVLTMFGIGKWGLPADATYGALFGLLTVLGVSIGGDTYRPSGQSVASHHAHKVVNGNGHGDEEKPE